MSTTRFRVGDWQADPALDEIRRGEQLVKLEPRAMRVLMYLAQRPGVVVSADELLEAVWPGLVVGQNSVYQAVALLRRVFGDDSESPTYIATVPRKGYRLIAEVSAAQSATPEEGAMPGMPGPGAESPPLPATPARRRAWLAIALASAGILSVLLVSAWFWREPSASAAAAPASVAVLPFADLSPGKDNQAFCDGLTEEIINSLGRTGELRVTARTSAFSFREQQSDVRDIGEQLGVTHLVEGSVRRTDGRIRISAHLVNVNTGYQEWAESFDRPFADVLEVQEDISQSVARALAVRLAPRKTATELPTPGAYDLYLLGRFQQLERQPASIEKAMQYHRAAIELDPTFALAYAGLANSYMLGHWYANYRLDDAVKGVRENVAKALAANPDLAEAYVARGRMFLETLDLAASEQDFKRAIELNGSLSEAYIGLAMVYEYRGDPRGALGPLERAAALDPLHVILHGRRCQALLNLNRFAEAEKACQRVIDIQPSIPSGHWGKALIAFAQGRTDAAILGYREALTRAPDRWDLRTQLAWLYLDAGLPRQAAMSYPTLERGHAEYNAIELERARGWIAARDLPGLIEHLSGLQLQVSTNNADLLDAALLEMAAGRAPVARALVERVTSDPEFDLLKRIENTWTTRWGRNDGVTLALVARAAGDHPAAQRYLDLTLAWLDRIERNGLRAHGVQYVRAQALALRGESADALAALRRARDMGWRSAWWMVADPALASLRGEPGFTELLREMETQSAAYRDTLMAAGISG